MFYESINCTTNFIKSLPHHIKKKQLILCSMVRASGKCVNNYPTRCNNIQFIYICKPLYMFRLVSPPIIRSSYHCIYSNWHYWDCYCYLSWTWLDGNYFPSSHVHHLVTSTTCSSNGLNNARYCRYSDMSSWWWVEMPPVTCRAVCR